MVYTRYVTVGRKIMQNQIHVNILGLLIKRKTQTLNMMKLKCYKYSRDPPLFDVKNINTRTYFLIEEMRQICDRQCLHKLLLS